jgi:DNA-binding transcriptional LysR family regulator
MRKELDLKMLYFFRALYLSGNVSLASDQLGFSQPSGSLLLKRLRREFNDVLFVRIGQKMVPTPGAQQLFVTVSEVLGLIDNKLESSVHFDPYTSQRNFTIAMTDISQIALVPRLIDFCKSQGVNKIKFIIRDIDEDVYSYLESGEVNLAVGFLTNVPDDYFQQRLFEEQYVCLSSRMHPRIKQPPTLGKWKNEHHILVQGAGTGHTCLKYYLEHHGIQQNIAMVIPSFLGVGSIVASSELLAIVPKQFAVLNSSACDCVFWPLPVSLPSITIRQIWHQRYHNDPGLIWLRKQLAKLTQAS